MKPYKLAFLLILVGFVTVSTPVKSLDDSDCEDYEFIFARGSGQSLNDVDYQTFKSEIEVSLKDEKYNFYELGTKNNGYPAFSPKNVTSVLGTYLSAGESYKFGESVEKGVEELISHLKSETSRCKNKKYILSGYSQGAFVIDKTLPYLNSEKIFYVATFGDPKLYLPEGKTKTACQNFGFSRYRIYVPDCEVEEGVFGGMNPYEDNNYRDKRGAWCNLNDFICGSRLNITDLWKGHTSYNGENGYKKFAELIAEKISEAPKTSPETEARYSDAKKRDIVVVYDYRGRPFSDKLKHRLVELAEHGTRIAVYALYSYSNMTKHLEEAVPFTNDNLGAKIDEMNFKFSLSVGNISGGGNNLFYAIKELSKTADWEQGSERNIFLFSNRMYSDYVSFDGTTIDDAISVAKNHDVKVSILSEEHVEENINFLRVVNSTGGEAIGSNYNQIILNQSETIEKPEYFSKTFKLNQDSKYTLVIINDVVYGVSDKDKIVIKNLDKNRLNVINLLEYDARGIKMNEKTFRLGTEKAPDSGKPKL